jgi:hypothetical protein
VNPLSDDTLPCLPPVIELDPSELVAEGGGIVTALDAVTAVARALPTRLGSRPHAARPEDRMTWNRLYPPLTLTQGRTYSALLHLSWAEKAFATPGAIEAKLEGAGFTGVSVDMNGDGGPLATGSWGQPTQSGVTLPEEIVSVWEWQL